MREEKEEAAKQSQLSSTGCETKKPHLADPIIKTLFDGFAQADKEVRWVLMGIQELRDSFRDDVERHRFFVWFTRMR